MEILFPDRRLAPEAELHPAEHGESHGHRDAQHDGRQARSMQQVDDRQHLRGCFKGDRVTLCARPEELRVANKPGENRIRATLRRTTERPQSIRADFGGELVVDVPRESWTENPDGLWIEIPAESLRQLSG